jgi:hypothetical protein
MANPPAIRQVINDEKVWARAVRREDTTKSSADRISSFFRPKRSLMLPERTEPRRQPMRAQLFAQPMLLSEMSWKYFS